MTDSIHDQLELYAAASLTPEEMVAFDEHLWRCALCQSQAPNALETVAAVIPDSPAPSRAWSRIVAAIES